MGVPFAARSWYNGRVVMGMTIADMQLRDALVDARQRAIMAARYEERAAEMTIDGVSSPQLDRQPCGSGPGMGVPRAVARDAIKRAAAAARQEADIAQRRARRLLCQAGYIGAKMVYYDAYYCRGMTHDDASALADRTPRQCMRYRRDLMGSMAP